MATFTVLDAKDAPLAPGMKRIEMPDGTYRVLMPWEIGVVANWSRVNFSAGTPQKY